MRHAGRYGGQQRGLRALRLGNGCSPASTDPAPDGFEGQAQMSAWSPKQRLQACPLSLREPAAGKGAGLRAPLVALASDYRQGLARSAPPSEGPGGSLP